jgi:hypothetical protein
MPPTALRTAALWLAFAAVHAWLWVALFIAPHTPLNDVTTVYRDWVQQGEQGFGWVGIDRAWVYPSAALLPMLAAAAAGLTHYSVAWLVLVVLLDGIALAVITRGGTATHSAGWWWLAFLLLLGPIALGRLDTVSVPLALVGLLFAVRRPIVAGVLLALATWIKVWPAAVLLAVIVASRRRIPVALAAVATSLAVVAAVLGAGGSLATVFGFVGQQTGRGLQIEAPVTTWWLWLEVLHVPGAVTSFDRTLLTFQATGPGAGLAAALMTPVMAVVMLGTALLGVRAVRRGEHATVVLAPLALALVAAFIVTNKVGSPQYQTWLAVPVALGLVMQRRGGGSFVAPAVVSLVVAGLTQLIYPWNYDALVLAHPWMVGLVTVRNLLLVALLALGALRLWRAGRDGLAAPSARLPEQRVPAVTG